MQEYNLLKIQWAKRIVRLEFSGSKVCVKIFNVKYSLEVELHDRFDINRSIKYQKIVRSVQGDLSTCLVLSDQQSTT